MEQYYCHCCCQSCFATVLRVAFAKICVIRFISLNENQESNHHPEKTAKSHRNGTGSIYQRQHPAASRDPLNAATEATSLKNGNCSSRPPEVYAVLLKRCLCLGGQLKMVEVSPQETVWVVIYKKNKNAPKIIKDECGCCGSSDKNWRYL